MPEPLRWDQPGLTWNTPGLTWNGQSITLTKSPPMPPIVLNLKDVSDTQIADQLRAKALTLTQNAADFPEATPTAAELNTAAGNIDSGLAIAAAKAQEATAATSTKDNLVEEGREALRALARYAVDKKLAADIVEKLFHLKKAPVPTTSIGQVLRLTATYGDKAGEIDLTWEPVARRRIYQVEWRLTSPDGVWTLAKSPTASKVTLTGLPSGRKVAIRVRAIGPKELEGEW